MIVYTSQCNIASSKRKTIVFKTEEELADAVNEIVNDSDSDTDNIPEFSSSGVNLKVQMRVIMRVTFQYWALAADRQMLPQLQGFLKMIINQEYHPSKAIWVCNLQLQYKIRAILDTVVK